VELKRATRQLLEAIKANERGSYAEWVDACGFSSTAVVQYHLKKLQAARLIKRHPGRARSVELIREDAHDAGQAR